MGADWLDSVKWNAGGLVPAVAQEGASGGGVLVARVNRDSLRATLDSGEAVYWSRSRSKLWRKGEESGHVQKVREVRLDCDEDALLLRVEQLGGIACHTGRQHCFFRRHENGSWVEIDPVIKDPKEIYRK